MHANNPASPIRTLHEFASGSRTLMMIGFTGFVVGAFPLVVCALAGVQVNAVHWVFPFVIPGVLELYRRWAYSMTPEQARQAADISRWEV